MHSPISHLERVLTGSFVFQNFKVGGREDDNRLASDYFEEVEE